jgi:hypothetical protein
VERGAAKVISVLFEVKAGSRTWGGAGEVLAPSL